MLALGLTILLFAFWGVVGYAVIRAIGARMDGVQEMLLAPVVGLIVVTISVFMLNRFGLPVKRFAYPLTIVLLIAAAVPLLIARPRMPWRDWAPFAGIAVAALLLAGWPMLQYGFDWLSLCNDDMANYCLGATRFYDYPFFHNPAPKDMLDGVDYSHYYWFLHVKMQVRPGIELVLAWVMGVTRMTPHQVFMPLVMALHMCQVCALGALMLPSPQTRKPALAACALLAVSALATFGALYQLIAQVGGMALVAGTAAVLLRPFADAGGPTPPAGGTSTARAAPPGGSPVRRGVLAGVMGAGLFLLYPESIPIIGASWMLFLLFEALHRRVKPKPILLFLSAALVAVLVLLGRQAIGIAGFMFSQAAAGSSGLAEHEALFPYYQLPSGVADFWGFFPLTYVPNEPWASLAIAWAFVLLLMLVAAALWLAWRRQGVALVCVVMLALASYLVSRGAQFGTYKMAMFLQPFALGTVAVAAFMFVKKTWVRTVLFVLVAAPGVLVQWAYVNGSRGTGAAGGFPEVADPSGSRVNQAFARVVADQGAAAAERGLVSDTSSIVLAKFQSFHSRGIATSFPVAPVGTSLLIFLGQSLAPPEVAALAERLRDAVIEHRPQYQFHLHDPEKPSLTTRFFYPELGPLAGRTDRGVSPQFGGNASAPAPLMIVTGPKQTILNRWGPLRESGAAANQVNFVARPMDRLRNHLLLIDTDLGRSYYSTAKDISMFQLEPDPTFLRDSTMAGIGRRFVFQVVGPTPGMRLVVEMSASLKSDKVNLLPENAAAIGTQRLPLGMTGRGSARVFSQPLEPQVLGGRSFVGIDLAREPVQFRRPRKGLMLLYGRDILLDRRRLVGFGRNISAISERQYAALRPPSRLEQFPRDLQNQDLEYSGFYEDGWVSDRAWCALVQPWDAGEVVVKGYVPDLNDKSFQTELTVLVEGREVARKAVGLKDFELRAAVPKELLDGAAAGVRRRVEIRASRLQALPAPDMRPVCALISSIGFDSPPAPPVAVRTFPRDVDGNPLLSPAGLYPDGWAAPRTSVRLSQPPGFGYLAVRGQVPRIGNGEFSTTVRVRVDGRQVAEQALRVGPFELVAPAPAESSSRPPQRQVELEFDKAQQLPGGDGRAVGAQIQSLGFEPEPLPPTKLTRFPDDLRRPAVNAAGLYDDGWLAQDATLHLAQPADGEVITLSGMVPRIGDAEGFTTEVTVTCDGREVARKTVGLDAFTIEGRVPPSAAVTSTGAVSREVGVKFSRTQPLPAPDGRAVGAKLLSVEFNPPGE